MPRITVDGRDFEVPAGRQLLETCLTLGFDLPYFCWHPAMGSVGACRQCAVKQFRDDDDTQGRIVMACMTNAADGTRISIDDPEAAAFRASVIEWLMMSHPHDCPICDEGGECHLQDMTVMTGHDYRRFDGLKRTFRNQDLGPLVNHEMNRCIQCYRCVRFYQDVAGGGDLGSFHLHDTVFFGRSADGTLESEFAGNLVEVCPTGVFTDKTLKQHYTRKWDLQTAPSVCQHCGVGCNTIAGERYGTLRRVLNRYHDDINGYWLCDRGRFGYEYVNDELRLLQAVVRPAPDPGAPEAGVAPDAGVVDPAAAVEQAAGFLRDAGDGRVIGIGSPRASLEANWALRRLVGADRFYAGIDPREHALVRRLLDVLRDGPAPAASLGDVRQSDAVLVLGEDPTNAAPMLDLALREAARQAPLRRAEGAGIEAWNDRPLREFMQDDHGPVFIATPQPVKLDALATASYRAAPDDVARLGFAVAHALDDAAPAVDDLDDATHALAERIAAALRDAERPVVVTGPTLGSEAVVDAAADVARALCAADRPARLCAIAPAANSIGLAMLAPGSLDAAFDRAHDGDVGAAIVLECDLFRAAARDEVERFLHAAGRVIALDATRTATVAAADVALPAAATPESDGTFVNHEGRAQRFFQVYVPADPVRESWRWLRDLAPALGAADAVGWAGLDDVIAALVAGAPALSGVAEAAPPASFRTRDGRRIARETPRFSGRTAMHADRTVREPAPPGDVDAPLVYSMEGSPQGPPALNPRYWAPGWNSVQSLNKFQDEVGGPLRGGDPGRRLIEPARSQGGAYRGADSVPAAFAPREGERLVVPLPQIFGGEEQSARAPAIVQLTSERYLAVGDADAQALGLIEGATAELRIGAEVWRLPVRRASGLPPGIVGMAAGLPAPGAVALPAWGAIGATAPSTQEPRGGLP